VSIPVRAHQIGAVGMPSAAGQRTQPRRLGPEVVGTGTEHALEDRAVLGLGRPPTLGRPQLEAADISGSIPRTVSRAIGALPMWENRRRCWH
jgi:hypothetical protein